MIKSCWDETKANKAMSANKHFDVAVKTDFCWGEKQTKDIPTKSRTKRSHHCFLHRVKLVESLFELCVLELHHGGHAGLDVDRALLQAHPAPKTRLDRRCRRECAAFGRTLAILLSRDCVFSTRKPVQVHLKWTIMWFYSISKTRCIICIYAYIYQTSKMYPTTNLEAHRHVFLTILIILYIFASFLQKYCKNYWMIRRWSFLGEVLWIGPLVILPSIQRWVKSLESGFYFETTTAAHVAGSSGHTCLHLLSFY